MKFFIIFMLVAQTGFAETCTVDRKWNEPGEIGWGGTLISYQVCRVANAMERIATVLERSKPNATANVSATATEDKGDK